MGWTSAIPIIGPIIDAFSQNAQAQTEAQISRENTDKTIAANKELAQAAYDQNVKMWNMQNAYNSPQAQMERYKQAGLNPNLAVAGGNPGNASGIPSYQAPRVDYQYKGFNPAASLAGKLTEYMSFKMQQAQLQNMQSQGEGIELDNRIKGLQGDFLQSSYGARVSGEAYKSQLSSYRAGIAKQQYEGDFGKFQADAMKIRNQREQSMIDLLGQNIIFKQLENQWMRSGVTRSDNPFLRMGVRAMDYFGLDKYFNPNKLK